MKRFGDGEEGEMESINVANVLMLLSRGGGEEFIDVVSSRASSPVRVFECKTCSRQFPSFQALGGHRASHKKPRLPAVEGQGNAELLAKPRAHECSICGLEFAIGQALGGHMRRHRAATVDGVPHALSEKKKPPDERRDGLWLDLNLPPASEEERDGGGGGCRRKVFGFELVDTTPAVVDYFH